MERGASGKPLAALGKERDAPEILQRDDYLTVDLDLRRKSVLDLDSFYRIAVNPAGAVADGVMMVPVVHQGLHHSGWQEFWNPEGVRTAVVAGEKEWTAELALPAKIFPGLDLTAGKSIRMQIVRAGRSDPRGMYTWSPMLVEEYEYDLSRMGRLVLE